MIISINDFDRLISKIRECQREYHNSKQKMNDIQMKVGNLLLEVNDIDLSDMRKQYDDHKWNCEFYSKEFEKYKSQLASKVDSIKLEF
jgi:peptidoglycan hydrolase CwlO-like protein